MNGRRVAEPLPLTGATGTHPGPRGIARSSRAVMSKFDEDGAKRRAKNARRSRVTGPTWGAMDATRIDYVHVLRFGDLVLGPGRWLQCRPIPA